MLVRLVLTLFVISFVTVRAFALEACFTDSAGSWRGPVLNAGELQTMDTEFRQEPDGTLSGRYHVHDLVPFDGALVAFHQTGTCEADFTWRDRFGSGTVHIRFEPEADRFLGIWGIGVPIQGALFNGYRQGPDFVS